MYLGPLVALHHCVGAMPSVTATCQGVSLAARVGTVVKGPNNDANLRAESRNQDVALCNS